MRSMFDGIIPGEVPAGAQLYAAYLDGTWDDYNAMVAKYPGAIHVSIAVSAGHNEGQVLDVEKGDATPAESVGWVLNRRAGGVDPTVYCSMSAWTAVTAAFKARGVAEPHYWIADYSLGNSPALPAGAVALQYADRGGYDESVVADYWPGVDPAPNPQPPAATESQEDDMQPYLISVIPDPTSTVTSPKGAGIFLVDGRGSVIHIPSPADEADYVTMYGAPRPRSPQMYANLRAAAPKSGA